MNHFGEMKIGGSKEPLEPSKSLTPEDAINYLLDGLQRDLSNREKWEKVGVYFETQGEVDEFNTWIEFMIEKSGSIGEIIEEILNSNESYEDKLIALKKIKERILEGATGNFSSLSVEERDRWIRDDKANLTEKGKALLLGAAIRSIIEGNLVKAVRFLLGDHPFPYFLKEEEVEKGLVGEELLSKMVEEGIGVEALSKKEHEARELAKQNIELISWIGKLAAGKEPPPGVKKIPASELEKQFNKIEEMMLRVGYRWDKSWLEFRKIK